MTAATSSGARGTSLLPAGEFGETILTTTDGAGTDPQTEMTLGQERSQRASGMKQQTRNALLAVIAVVVLSLGIWWAFSTPRGSMQIEITDDQIEVTLGESGRTLRGQTNKAVKLPIGEHVLHVQVGEVKLDTPEITVAKGESVAIKVERVGSRVRVMRDGEFLIAKELPRSKASGTKTDSTRKPASVAENFALEFDGKSNYVEIPTLSSGLVRAFIRGEKLLSGISVRRFFFFFSNSPVLIRVQSVFHLWHKICSEVTSLDDRMSLSD